MDGCLMSLFISTTYDVLPIIGVRLRGISSVILKTDFLSVKNAANSYIIIRLAPCRKKEGVPFHESFFQLSEYHRQTLV